MTDEKQARHRTLCISHRGRDEQSGQRCWMYLVRKRAPYVLVVGRGECASSLISALLLPALGRAGQ